MPRAGFVAVQVIWPDPMADRRVRYLRPAAARGSREVVIRTAVAVGGEAVPEAGGGVGGAEIGGAGGPGSAWGGSYGARIARVISVVVEMFAWSVTRTSNWWSPARVGVPWSTPSEVRVMPAGSAPDVTCHV